MTWQEVIRTTRGRWVIAFCVATILMIIFYMPHYYKEVIGPKPGFLLSDFILESFTPRNWSLVIFIILYIAVIQTLISYINRPTLFLTAVITYCLVNIFRILTMYLVTLEPPTGMILLADPISSIAYPDKGFAKDLFFSGHVSTMVAVIVIEKNRVFRIAKIAGATVMAVLLAWQHVHYTIDLIAAPIITYGIYVLVKKQLDFDAIRQDVN